MGVQQYISLEKNQAKVGKNFKVMIDRMDDQYFIGRTEFDSPEVDNEVLIPIQEGDYASVGRFVNVSINRAEEFDLYGSLIK